MIKNLLTMRETQVQFHSQEDPLEKGLATTPVFLLRESHEQRSLEATVQGVTKSQARLGKQHLHLVTYTISTS